MNIDVELDAWRREWQATTPQAGEEHDLAHRIEQRVARDSRRIKIGLVAPILVTLGIGGPIAWHALAAGSAADIILAAGTWLYIAIAWAGALWIARGTWRPLAESTAAFIELSIRRNQANLRAVPLGVALYAGQLLFVVLWKYFSTPDYGWAAVLTSWNVILLGWLGFPAFLIGGYWYRWRQRSELEGLLLLRAQLEEQ